MKHIFLICCLVFATVAYSQTCDLTVSIPNLKNRNGLVQIGVYNKKDAFPKDKKEYKLFVFDVKTFTGKYTINNLPKGEYAIALMHDENADKVCNLNFLGIPKEGYGFSKNFKPKFSAPSFDDCKIDLQSNMSITINLIY